MAACRGDRAAGRSRSDDDPALLPQLRADDRELSARAAAMTDLPGIGHNQRPPDPIGRMRDLIATANRWSAERPAITDSEMAGVAQELLKQLRDNRTDLEAAMKAEREPLDLAVAAIRVKYRDSLELIGIAITRMREKLAPWLKREQDRLDAEAVERAQQAQDAAAQADAAR